MSLNAAPGNATPPPSREATDPRTRPGGGVRDETVLRGGGAESQTPSEGGRGALERLEETMRKPAVGASVSGALVLGAAAFFGVLETAIAAGAAYAAYRLLKKKPATSPPPASRPRG
jgi:hypothetical protein